MFVFDLNKPPTGSSLQTTADGFVAGGSTRSGEAWLLIPFMLLWSGVTLGGICLQLDTAGAMIFGILFVLGTILSGIRALMRVCGWVEVGRNGDRGWVFEGIGPIGWRREFQWSDVRTARYSRGSWRWHGHPPELLIEINFLDGTNSSLKFGTLLTDEYQGFLLAVIHSQISPLVRSNQ